MNLFQSLISVKNLPLDHVSLHIQKEYHALPSQTKAHLSFVTFMRYYLEDLRHLRFRTCADDTFGLEMQMQSRWAEAMSSWEKMPEQWLFGLYLNSEYGYDETEDNQSGGNLLYPKGYPGF